MFDPSQRQRDRRKAAINNQPQLALWQPAAHLCDHLPHPIYARLMAPLGLLCGPAQRRERGQRPDPPGPRHRHQKHHRHPLQAEAADDVLLGGAHRIARASLGGDLPSTTACERIVCPQDQWSARRHQAADEDTQKNPAPLTGRPPRPVQDPMIVREAALHGQPHHPQSGCDRAGPGGQKRAQEQDLGMAPDPGRK